mgnify:CR=1 FL=1
MEDRIVNTEIQFSHPGQKVCFSLEPSEEDDFYMDLLVTKRSSGDEEDEVLAMLTLPEIKYLAHRMLDAVAYQRERLDDKTPREYTPCQ